MPQALLSPGHKTTANHRKRLACSAFCCCIGKKERKGIGHGQRVSMKRCINYGFGHSHDHGHDHDRTLVASTFAENRHEVGVRKKRTSPNNNYQKLNHEAVTRPA